MTGTEKRVKLLLPNPLILYGWETWIRTTIHGVRVRCPTIERSPIGQVRAFSTGMMDFQQDFFVPKKIWTGTGRFI